MTRVVRIEELEPIAVAGVNWRPLRRTLGVTAFGINAYSAGAGEQLIEPHDESGADGEVPHEELYIVVSGRATFTVDGEEIDAPAGTIVYVDDPASRRQAVAAGDGTTAVAVGGPAGSITPSSWEYRFAALPVAESGEPQRAYEIAAAGLADHPDDAGLHYELACFASLAGDHDRALDHLNRALTADPGMREHAASDPDLDPIRSDPRYPG